MSQPGGVPLLSYSTAACARRPSRPSISSCSCMQFSNPRINISVAATNNAHAFHQICLEFLETGEATSLWWLRAYQSVEGEELNLSTWVNFFICMSLYVLFSGICYQCLKTAFFLKNAPKRNTLHITNFEIFFVVVFWLCHLCWNYWFSSSLSDSRNVPSSLHI